MAQINSIRQLFFEKGLNYAEISRITGVDVKTVKKYIRMEDFNQPLPKPRQIRGSKLDKYKEQIDKWMIDDKQVRKKQRHTAKRIFDRLRKEHPDFDCSYRLVANYVSQKKKEIYGGQDGFYMPLVHIPGEAQVDFGEADFFERNVRYRGHYLNVSFPHSNAGYLQVFKGENMQCLAEGLINIFRHIGGVPTRLWFDNLSPAVKTILKDDRRELTDAFLRFKNHYGFDTAFCNRGKGHEKGSVETKVGYHRRNMLVPVPEVDDLKAFNRGLLEECDQDMLRPHYLKKRLHKDLFEEDLKAFLPLPSMLLDAYEIKVVRTDSYAKFTLNKGKHTYSTAPRYAKSEVFVQLTAYDVIALDENYREIVRHPRLYGDYEQESMDWLPYLTQLSRRPRALKYTGIYPMLPQDLQEFLDSCNYQTKKETLKVLAKLSERSSFSKAVEAVRSAILHGARDADSIVTMFNRLNTDIMDLAPMILAGSVPEMPPAKPNLGSYDHILFGSGECREG
jgi:transposase